LGINPKIIHYGKSNVRSLPPPQYLIKIKYIKHWPAFKGTIACFLYLLIMVLATSSLSAQIMECFVEQTSSPDSLELSHSSSCYDPESGSCNTYTYPFSKFLHQFDITTVYLNFHFLETAYSKNFGRQNANCPNCPDNNFWSGDQIAQYFVNELNARMGNLADFLLYVDKLDTLNPPIPFKDILGNVVLKPGNGTSAAGDTRIRFALYSEDDASGNPMGAVHYHDLGDVKPRISSLNPGCTSTQHVTLMPENLKDEFSVYKNKVVDIFLFDEWLPSDACLAQRGMGGNTSCTIGNLHRYFVINQTLETPVNSNSIWGYRAILLHELGHVMGLSHPVGSLGSGKCCDAHESPYLVNPNQIRYGTSNNIMGYNPHSNAISPCQLDIMYRNIRKRQYINGPQIIGYCSKQHGLDTITTHEVWSTNKVVTRDIVIKSGGSLTIIGAGVCIGFAKDVIIQVERGAILTVEKATLRSLCTFDQTFTNDQDIFPRHWGGIRVVGNSSKPHPQHYGLSIDPDDPGRVILIDATILNARHAISTKDHFDQHNPQKWGGYFYVGGSNFLGYHRVIEIMKYNLPSNNYVFNSIIKGYLNTIDERFYSPEELANVPSTNKRCVGISIWDSHNLLIEQSEFSGLYPYGIFAIDGQAKIWKSNVFSGIEGPAIWGGETKRAFNRIWTIGSNSGAIFGNAFTNNILDIKLDNLASLEGKIENNNFNGISPHSPTKAIEIAAAGVEIRNNVFKNKRNAISTSNGFSKQLDVRENEFDNNVEGIYFYGLNTESNYSCNLFTNILELGVHIDGDLSNQGNPRYSNYNYWHRTLRMSDAFDIWRGESSFTSHVYFVQKDEPLNSPFRPQCNLTQSCPTGLSSTPFYETGNADENKDDCILPRPPKSESAITQINHKITNLQNFKANPDSLKLIQDLESEKLSIVYSVLDSLGHLNQFSKIDSLLAAQNEIEYAAMRFELALDQSSITIAQQRLQEVTTKDTLQLWSDYIYVQNHNLARIDSFEYRPSQAEQAEIVRISKTQNQSGGIARLLLCYWYDMVPLPFFSDPILPAMLKNDMLPQDFVQQSTLIEHALQVKPNPGNGNYRITVHNFEEFRAMPLTLRIFDFSGKMVQHIEGVYSGTEFGLDLQNLPAGLYLVQLVHQEAPISLPVKLIKQ
jgi:hypothetical protein